MTDLCYLFDGLRGGGATQGLGAVGLAAAIDADENMFGTPPAATTPHQVNSPMFSFFTESLTSTPVSSPSRQGHGSSPLSSPSNPYRRSLFSRPLLHQAVHQAVNRCATTMQEDMSTAGGQLTNEYAALCLEAKRIETEMKRLGHELRSVHDHMRRICQAGGNNVMEEVKAEDMAQGVDDEVENGDDGPATVKKSLSTALSMIQRIMPDFAWAVHVDNELSAAEIDTAFDPVAADIHVKTTLGYGLQESEFPRRFIDYSTTKVGEETISWRSATAYVFTVLMKRNYHRFPTEKETAVFWALDVATTLRNRWSTRFSRSKKKNKQEQA